MPRTWRRMQRVQVSLSNSPTMNVILSPEDARFITKYAKLTGYTEEEFATMCLADFLKMFENSDGSFLREPPGRCISKDRAHRAGKQTLPPQQHRNSDQQQRGRHLRCEHDGSRQSEPRPLP